MGRPSKLGRILKPIMIGGVVGALALASTPLWAQEVVLTSPESNAIVNANTRFSWELPAGFTRVTFFIKAQDEEPRTLVLSDNTTFFQNVTTGRNALFFHRGQVAQWWIRACHRDNPNNCIQPAASRAIRVALMGLYLNKYLIDANGTLVENTQWNTMSQPLINAQLPGRRPIFQFFNTGTESMGAQWYQINLAGSGANLTYRIPAADQINGTLLPDNSETYLVPDPDQPTQSIGQVTYREGFYTFVPSQDLPAAFRNLNGDQADVYWDISACRRIPADGNIVCGGAVMEHQVRMFKVPNPLGNLPNPNIPGFDDPGINLSQTFGDPRCIQCHIMLKPGQASIPGSVANRHLGRVPGANNAANQEELNALFSNSANCVGCHQANLLTDVMPVAHPMDPWAWFAPLYEGNLTWPDEYLPKANGLIDPDPEVVCNLIKNFVGNDASAMEHHLMQDPRVLWSFMSGRTPGVDLTPAPPYDPQGPGDDGTRAEAAYQEWKERVETWVAGGMNCESGANFGSTAAPSGPLGPAPPGGDTLPPTTDVNWPTGFYNDPKLAILLCSDTGGSGCQGTYYFLSPGTCEKVRLLVPHWVPYSGPIPINGTGPQCLQFYSLDQANNKEDPVRFVEYFLDFEKPQTMATVHRTMDPMVVQLRLRCTDGNGPGCWVTRYRIDGNPGDPILAPYQEPLVIDRSEDHTVYFYSQDRALNPEVPQNIQISSLDLVGGEPIAIGPPLRELLPEEDREAMADIEEPIPEPDQETEESTQQLSTEPTNQDQGGRANGGCQLRK